MSHSLPVDFSLNIITTYNVLALRFWFEHEFLGLAATFTEGVWGGTGQGNSRPRYVRSSGQGQQCDLTDPEAHHQGVTLPVQKRPAVCDRLQNGSRQGNSLHKEY